MDSIHVRWTFPMKFHFCHWLDGMNFYCFYAWLCSAELTTVLVFPFQEKCDLLFDAQLSYFEVYAKNMTAVYKINPFCVFHLFVIQFCFLYDWKKWCWTNVFCLQQILAYNCITNGGGYKTKARANVCMWCTSLYSIRCPSALCGS